VFDNDSFFSLYTLYLFRMVVKKKVIEKKGYIVKVNNFINISNMTNYFYVSSVSNITFGT
jgi:hypothetical protein